MTIKQKIVFSLLALLFILSSCNTVVEPTPTITPEPTITPQPTATQTSEPTPTKMGGGSGRVLLEYLSKGYANDFPNLEGRSNIFFSNFDGSDLSPITNGLRGVNQIEAVSQDGREVLISSFNHGYRKNDSNGRLYLYDLENPQVEPVEIASSYSQFSNKPAAGFISESRLLYIGKGDDGYGIYTVKKDGSDPVRIDEKYRAIPYQILAINDTRVFWNEKVHSKYGIREGDFKAVWWTNLDGSDQGKLTTNGIQVEYGDIFKKEIDFSPDGSSIAWIPTVPEPECDTIAKLNAIEHDPEYDYDYIATCHLLYIADLEDMDNPLKIPIIPPKDHMPDNFAKRAPSYYILWSKDSETLFMYFPSWHYMKDVKMYFVDMTASNPVFDWWEDFPKLKSNFESSAVPSLHNISPDSKAMIVKMLNSTDDTQMALVNLETNRIENEFLQILNRTIVLDAYLLP